MQNHSGRSIHVLVRIYPRWQHRTDGLSNVHECDRRQTDDGPHYIEMCRTAYIVIQLRLIYPVVTCDVTWNSGCKFELELSN